VHNRNYMYWNASAWVVGGDESVYLGGGAGVGGIGGSGATGPGNVAIGTATAAAGQDKDAIAIGRGAGTASVLDAQSESAVAIGALAGGDAGQGSVAVGEAAGHSSGLYGVSVGSASQSKGSSAVSVGYGATATGNNSIVINATGVQLTAAAASTCRIAPIALASSTAGLNALYYNPGTFEVVATSPSYLYASNAMWSREVNYTNVVHFGTYAASDGWAVTTLESSFSAEYYGKRYTCSVPGVYSCKFAASIRIMNLTGQFGVIGIEVVRTSGSVTGVANMGLWGLANQPVFLTAIGIVQLLAGESLQCVCRGNAYVAPLSSFGKNAGYFTATRIG
jgi:hypothetical protein